MHDYIEQKLADRQAAGTYRQLRPESLLIDFCSNDYLGFARSARLYNLVAEEIASSKLFSSGSTGSRLLAGNTSYAEELEQEIANYHEAEAGLLFNSGYDANVGLLSSLPQRGDTVIHDELIHASIIDGIRLSYASRYNFKHNDLNSLEEKLKQAKGNIYVVVESIYSMDGDAAPLTAISKICKQYNAALIVDEAHATGVLGKGLVNQLNLEANVLARVITFGKALGCHGAIVLGNQSLRNYLVNFARSFIYTTAAPLHQLATIKMAYRLLQEDQDSLKKLYKNINLYTSQLPNFATSTSAIQTFILGSNEKAKATASMLQQQGMDVRPILSPTVAVGTERLRICLHAYNMTDEIMKLTNSLNNINNV
ncbi:8-amino-7-oxononanoate synthase [Mucilaginibacter robiniae]|uniref:8-amino-7-oxononanoate synthase n=1 Tax=Mucilaginibacter robiniae TaxID=2728022 RepID=A0A7L5E635_9SPHI|nr:8-amino-7-oxononanoate synthase [Mucilaginibacter robiniae]